MHFTREPIIETIVTPREGYKLLVRSSKLSGGDEYTVDALEIVSFGHAYFYRSTEKPRPFLLSSTDYEVVETRETKIALKTTGVERGIKIGGGKKEVPEDLIEEVTEEEVRPEKNRERKRSRRRRGRNEEETTPAQSIAQADPFDTFMEVSHHPDHDKLISSPSEPVIPPSLNTLLPPPPTLISASFPKAAKEDAAVPLPETPQFYKEKVEELIDDITED